MIQLKKTVSAIAAAALLLCGCASKGSDKTVRESVTYELGEKVTLNAEEFIINANESDLKDAEVISSLTEDPGFDYLGFTKELKTKGKEYLEVGKYDVQVKYGGKTYNSKIVVEDTTPPSFISAPQSIVVAAGDTSFDPVRRFRIRDKDSFTVEMKGDYDLNTPGTYDVTIIATDKSGNKSSISITMKVLDGQQIITSQDQADEDFNDINEAGSGTDNNASSGETVDQPDDSNTNPDDSDNTTPTNTACSATNVSPGAPYYYSFDEAYAAGTAWNQQAPGNYFFYLVGADDCGQTIYVVTFGSNGSAEADAPERPTAPETQDPPVYETAPAPSLDEANQSSDAQNPEAAPTEKTGA